MTRTKLLAAAVLTFGLIATAAPAQATAPFLQVRVADYGRTGTIPTSAQATNMSQSTATIVISTTTPAVCTVPANSTTVGAYQRTAQFPVKLVGKGTCTIRAAHGGDVTERSYTIR
jgi:hypothetical protein